MRTLVIVLIVAVVAFGIGYLVFHDDGVDNPEVSPSPSASASPVARPSATPARTPRAWTVRLTGQGLNPKTLTIAAGDTVTIVNDTAAEYWPASDPHPTHTLCPGFDAKRGLKAGDSYSLAFPEKRTCTYHNHLDPANGAQKGSITVQ